VKKRDKLKFDIYTKTCNSSLNTLVIDMLFSQFVAVKKF